MKVLILITKSNWGGAQRYVFDLATNLQKSEFNVEVMAGGNGLLIERLIENGIEANGDLPVKRDISLFSDIKVFFKLIKILRSKRPDVLHINSSKIGGIGALAGRLTRIPKIVFTAHGFAFNENRSYINKLIIKFLHWLTIMFSHQTILVSNALKTQIENWPMINHKVSVVHNGISESSIFSKTNARLEITKMNERVAEIIKSHKDTIIIGSIGELHPIKGLDFAIKGISELINSNHNHKSRIIYIIMGSGEAQNVLEKYISDLGMNSNIFLLGYVKNAYEYIKAFDIFLIPSLSEGLPYIGLEAGLAGAPSIATAVGGIPEIIDDMKSGILIQPRKPLEIKHAIEFYMKHKDIQKEHGHNLHKKVMEEFNISNMVEKTIAVYKK